MESQIEENTDMEWTEKNVLILIDLFRKERNLWDPRDENYKNKNKKHDSLLELSKILGIEKAEVERKLKNMPSVL